MKPRLPPIRPLLGRALRVAAAITILVVTGAIIGGAPSPARAADRPETTPPTPRTTNEADNRPRLRLVDQTPFVDPMGNGTGFILRFRAPNAPVNAHLLFQLHPDVASSGRIRLLQSQQADGLGRPQRTIGPLPLDNLPADRDGVRTARFTIDPDRQPMVGFQLSREGVYPLAVSLREGADGADLDTMVTSIIRLPVSQPENNPPLAFAIVLPIGAPVGFQTDLTTTMPDNQVRYLNALVDSVAAHPSVPLSLAPTPETLDALVGIGRGDTVDRLADATAGRQVLGQPYVGLDLGSWVAAGMGAELDRQFDEGHLTAQRRLGHPVDGSTWAIDPTTTPEALAALRDRGVQKVIVPEDQLAPLTGPGFDVTLTRTFQVDPGSGPPLAAAMADRELRNHLLDSDDQRLNAYHVLADLAVLALDQPGVPRGAVLALPAGLTPPEFVDTLLGALTTASAATGGRPLVAPVTVDGLFTSAEPAGDKGGRVSVNQPSEPVLMRPFLSDRPTGLGSYPTQLSLARSSVGSYRSMVIAGEGWRADPFDRLLAVSGARSFDERHRQDHLDAAVARINAQTSLVALPEQPMVTLTAEDGRLSVVVQNDATYPIRAVLSLSTDKLEVDGGHEREVTLSPGTNRIDLPVRARSSGDISVIAALRSPDGAVELASRRFTVRSTAVSGLGLVLSVAAGLFLVGWWARHLRSSRRQHRLVSPSHPSRPRTVPSTTEFTAEPPAERRNAPGKVRG